MKPTPDEVAARLLADWESALVATMNPRLSEDEADELWKAIVAHRDHRSVEQLRDAIARAIPDRGARAIALRATRQLEPAPTAQE